MSALVCPGCGCVFPPPPRPPRRSFLPQGPLQVGVAASLGAFLVMVGIWWVMGRPGFPRQPAPMEATAADSQVSDSEAAAGSRGAAAAAQASRPIPGLPSGVATGSGTPLSDLATYYVHWLANLDEQRQAARGAIPAGLSEQNPLAYHQRWLADTERCQTAFNLNSPNCPPPCFHLRNNYGQALSTLMLAQRQMVNALQSSDHQTATQAMLNFRSAGNLFEGSDTEMQSLCERFHLPRLRIRAE